MILIEGVDRSEERVGYSRNLGEFFRWKFVQVFVERIARINPILDAIKAGEHYGREAQIGVCSRVRRAVLDAFRFGTRGIGRNTHGSRPVTSRIGKIHWRFESWHEPLVAVG